MPTHNTTLIRSLNQSTTLLGPTDPSESVSIQPRPPPRPWSLTPRTSETGHVGLEDVLCEACEQGMERGMKKQNSVLDVFLEACTEVPLPYGGLKLLESGFGTALR